MARRCSERHRQRQLCPSCDYNSQSSQPEVLRDLHSYCNFLPSLIPDHGAGCTSFLHNTRWPNSNYIRVSDVSRAVIQFVFITHRVGIGPNHGHGTSCRLGLIRLDIIVIQVRVSRELHVPVCSILSSNSDVSVDTIRTVGGKKPRIT